MRLTAYGQRVSDAPPDYWTAAAISLLSVTVQRKACIRMAQSVIFPNVWIFLLGPSTISRKSTVIKTVADIAQFIAAEQALPESFSTEALIEELADKPKSYLFKDEAAGLLSAMQKKYLADLKDLLCDIYEGRNFHRKLRKSQRKDRTQFIIHEPYVNILCATTPDRFKESTELVDLTSGWLVRFLYIYPTHRQKRKAFAPMDEKSRTLYNDNLRRLRSVHEYFLNSPELEFRLSMEALPVFQAWQLQREGEMMESDSTSDTELAIFGRLVPYVLKLAMLFKVGSTGFVQEIEERPPALRSEPVEIELSHVQEAIRMMDEYFLPTALKIVRMVEMEGSKNIQNRIVAVLERYGGRVRRRDLLRALHMRLKDVDEHIVALVEAEEIEVIERQPDGKPPYVVYSLTGGST
jgi:hypothetical protein